MSSNIVICFAYFLHHYLQKLTTIISASLGQSPHQLLVLWAPPAEPADLGLGAARQHRAVAAVAPHDGGDAPRGAELRDLLQHGVGDAGGDQDLLRVGGTQLVLLVGHGHAPRPLKVEPQPGQLAPEPGEVRHGEVPGGHARAQLLEGGLASPGEVWEAEYVLYLAGWSHLVENPPCPFFASRCVAELYSITTAILAVDMDEKEISLLQLFNQPQRNVQKSGWICHIQPKIENGLEIKIILLIWLYYSME